MRVTAVCRSTIRMANNRASMENKNGMLNFLAVSSDVAEDSTGLLGGF